MLRCPPVGFMVICLILTIDCKQSIIDSITPELFILDSSGNQQRVDDIALQFNSHVTLICRTSSRDTNLSWHFAVVDTNHFVPVTESEYLAVEPTRNGATALKLIKVRFSMAGTYQCTNKISTAQINVHVYGILKAISSTVQLASRKEMVGTMSFESLAFNASIKPTLACQFRVGRSGIKYTAVRWKGGLLATQPKLYDLSYSADEANGFIWSNLSILHPTFEPALYGKYQCLFNIIPGSMESEELEILLPPIIKRPDNLEGYHSGKLLSHRCEVVAYPPIDGPITWTRNEQPIEIDHEGKGHVAGLNWQGRVRFETERHPNDRIVFDPVLPEDRAVYSCAARSPLGNATGAFYLRVKDRWTIIWPLIGIIIELIILVVIIVVYEINRRKRAKQQENNDPTLFDRNSAAAYGGPATASEEMALRHRSKF